MFAVKKSIASVVRKCRDLDAINNDLGYDDDDHDDSALGSSSVITHEV